MNIIEFENINIGYDYRFLVLKNINLNIKEGEHWVILGANGSGKSTLLKLISNDLYPNTHYEFKKKIFGIEKWDIFDLKKKLGIVTNELQNEFVYQARFASGYEIVRSGFFASIGKKEHHIFTKEQNEKTDEIFDYLDIKVLKDKKASLMSTGELRKCLIARALIYRPKALLLDEPTTGLDIKAQKNFLSLIKRLTSTLSIIIITHHVKEIIEDISHVALIADNCIYKQGLKKDILTSANISKVFDLDIELLSKNNKYYIKED
ncbi:ABC transporter ATP-binding protein [Poseidonibacter parvus]|uniref:ABC transporter ATP-binding protein n=1 Tax=Poseidonibacter parvus TaxID=1850254 RepID=A0A1P8KJK1_9BACT|nr:ATP-binding cassette domain-containing protein [Poseidonibacter parvus]APW64720.1 ABC transporter ATP-binding protein [Poseidonibacter parvus]